MELWSELDLGMCLGCLALVAPGRVTQHCWGQKLSHTGWLRVLRLLEWNKGLYVVPQKAPRVAGKGVLQHFDLVGCEAVVVLDWVGHEIVVVLDWVGHDIVADLDWVDIGVDLDWVDMVEELIDLQIHSIESETLKGLE